MKSNNFNTTDFLNKNFVKLAIFNLGFIKAQVSVFNIVCCTLYMERILYLPQMIQAGNFIPMKNTRDKMDYTYLGKLYFSQCKISVFTEGVT